MILLNVSDRYIILSKKIVKVKFKTKTGLKRN